MTKLLDRVLVVLKAAPTYLTAIAVVLPLLAGDLAEVLPAGAAETVGEVALVIAAWLGAAVAIIRRVTPVAEHRRGLLP
ncbi:MAG: hypothetical protein AB7H43_15290 [Acidimicrobiia bacterium]